MRRADEGMGFILRYENVAWYENGKVRILDRRIYPIEIRFVECTHHEQVAQAIADMVTQSAGPYTAAAMGMALAAYEVRDKEPALVLDYMKKAAYILSHARPTTVSKMEKITNTSLQIVMESLKDGICGLELVERLKNYAIERINNNYLKYEKIGAYLADQIPQNGTIMTQCFAETVLGTLLKECRKRGNNIKVICPETRPYFQGARLTASLVCDMGFDVTVISDNMVGYTMMQKKVDLFTSAADVITMDGYVVNKVGTFQIALLAQYFGIPYYVTGTPNSNHPSIDTVKIEERDPELVTKSMDVKLTLDKVKGYYPAFDITKPELVTGIVTDKGIYTPENLYKYHE